MLHTGPSVREELVAAFVRRLTNGHTYPSVSGLAIALADDALSVVRAELDALMYHQEPKPERETDDTAG